MQNSEVEYKTKNKEQTFGCQTCQYSGVMRLCRRQANRVSVNLPVCPEFSPGTGREGGEERWQKRPLWATLWEMQHLHASEHKRSGGKRRTKRASLPLLSRLCQCTAPSERAYILGPRRVRRNEDRPVLHATPLQRQHSRISNDSMSSRY